MLSLSFKMARQFLWVNVLKHSSLSGPTSQDIHQNISSLAFWQGFPSNKNNTSVSSCQPGGLPFTRWSSCLVGPPLLKALKQQWVWKPQAWYGLELSRKLHKVSQLHHIVIIVCSFVFQGEGLQPTLHYGRMMVESSTQVINPPKEQRVYIPIIRISVIEGGMTIPTLTLG